MSTVPRFPRERGALRCAVPGLATGTPLQALAPPLQLTQARVTASKLRATGRRALYYPSCKQERPTGATLDSHSANPARVLGLWVRITAEPTSASIYWGPFALAALAVVFCSLHTMPARHGGPRVHSNNASRGAGRACTRLRHCGSHRARGACFASEPRFSKRLHHSVVGRRDGDLGVPIGLRHFSGPWFLEESRDPGL